MAATTSYSRLQIILHWLIAVLILALWLIEEETIHIPLGLAMLTLLGIRIALRLVHGAPGPLPGTSRNMALAAHLGHMALYLLMGVAALLGVILWLVDAKPIEEAHELASNALVLVALGHALAGVWHQVIKHDGTMDRMRLRAR